MNCPNCDSIVTIEPGSEPGLYDDGYSAEVYCDYCGWPDNIEEETLFDTTQDEALAMYSEWLESELLNKYEYHGQI